MAEKWHTLSVPEVERELDTNVHGGLSKEEAKKRQELYGKNELPEGKRENTFFVFVRQFQSPLIYVLFAASAVVFLMGKTADAAIIMAVLVFNAIIGVAQEGKAQKTLQALKKFAESYGTVVRDGEETVVVDGEIAVADMVLGKRDALGVWDTEKASLKAKKDAFVLAIEVPMSV